MRVEAKVAGQRRELFPPTEMDWAEPRVLMLAELLDLVVREEVAAFTERQQQHQLLQVLTPDAIAEGVAQGRVLSGGSDLDQPVDPEAAVATAHEAFRDGFYYVFLDGVQLSDLEQTVRVAPTSTLLFVRLVPLVGG